MNELINRVYLERFLKICSLVLYNSYFMKEANNNMDMFCHSWREAVSLLTETVDDIVTIDDYLAVTENHVLDDIKKCCMAMKQRDLQTLATVVGSVEARTRRISQVTKAEMERFEPGDTAILEAINWPI